jgi:hypothetical protein
MGMRPEKDLAAAQCAAKWAQKFALLLIFLASQEIEAGIDAIQSEMMVEIRQS